MLIAFVKSYTSICDLVLTQQEELEVCTQHKAVMWSHINFEILWQYLLNILLPF